MAGLRTEFEFTLPKGYVGDDGNLHRSGVMRLATARDEIEPLRDRSIDGPDDPYLTILVLARVISRLGSLESVGVREIEGLFAADLAFLQDLYGIINFGDQDDVAALQASVLPATAPDVEIVEIVDEVDDTDTDTDTDNGQADAADPEQTADPAAAAPAARRRRGRIEEVPRAASQ